MTAQEALSGLEMDSRLLPAASTPMKYSQIAPPIISAAPSA